MKGDLRSIPAGQPGWLPPPAADDVVVATRVRLTRNLSGFLFPHRAGSSSLVHVEEILRAALRDLPDSPFPLWARAQDIPLLVRGALSERLIGDEGLFGSDRRWALALSEDECTQAVVNFTDHLQLAINLPGFRSEEAWGKVAGIDDAIGASVDFAFDQEFGFLTSSLHEMGTGMRVSLILHLPALQEIGEIDRVSRASKEIGFRVEGLIDSGKALGRLYKMTNERTLGISEADIITGIGKAVAALELYERKAREGLLRKERRTRTEDRLDRAVGVLERAKLLPLDECLDYLSLVRLGAALGVLPKKAGALLFAHVFSLQNAHIQLSAGREMDDAERDSIRAETVRKSLHKALTTRSGHKEA